MARIEIKLLADTVEQVLEDLKTARDLIIRGETYFYDPTPDNERDFKFEVSEGCLTWNLLRNKKNNR